ncbi:MAG: ATP-binding cassette domain-containing protein, partial [Candidatus Zixiibacteriota bacterium]
GQQQRVAVARALINDPAIIMADEPTGNLDTRTSIEIMGIFQSLNRSGITVILITHEKDIAAYAKRNIDFRDGKIVRDEELASPKNAEDELRSLPPEEEEEI